MRRFPVILVLAAVLAAPASIGAVATPPSGVTGVALDGSVELAWQPVSGAGSYKVFRGTSANAIATEVTPPGGVAGTSFADTGAANGTTYYYVVRAISGGTPSGDSLTVQATPGARSCSSGNAVVLENCLPGSADWRVTNAGSVAGGGIEGYATATSIEKGESVGLKVNTGDGSTFRVEIYRSGYYGGIGARLLSTIRGVPGTLQPACVKDSNTGVADCANWSVSAMLTTTSSWTSGVYILRLVREGTGADNAILLVVRDDARNSDLLYGASMTTYQAYNNYGGKSLYDSSSGGATTVAGTARAVKVSFDRPFEQPRSGRRDWYTKVDYPLVYWLEREGFDVAYQSNTDLERNGARALGHRVYVSPAHDEYYSAGMREALEQARDAGVGLFFSGSNEIYWKVRFEPSTVSGVQDRVMVCYKTTQSGGPDPSGIPTGTWRDPAGANDPENALTGVMYVGDADNTFFPLVVSAAEGQDRVYRYTPLNAQSPGTSTSVGSGYVGWEWDARVANGAEPPGLVTLATSPVTGSLLQSDSQGRNVSVPGSTSSNVVKYTASSGALVFTTGTNFWARGLALNADGVGAPDLRIQQVTTNVLADMGVRPATPSSDIVLDEPRVVSKTPADGATGVTIYTPVRATFSHSMDASTISTSSFTLKGPDGSLVPASVAYDDATKSATLTPSSPLAVTTTYTARLEATIKSAFGTPIGGPVTWSFTTSAPAPPPNCPCTIFPSSAQPASQSLSTRDGRSGTGPWSLELGVKLKVDQPMNLTAIRFYKSAGETGTHVGKVWTAGGTQLATVTFASETASGWQQQQLETPLSLQAETTYVVSVNANAYYVATQFGLQNEIVSGPLHTIADGKNGVYGSAAGVFPTTTYRSSNYFVDLEVGGSTGPGAPTVTSRLPADGAANASRSSSVQATFSRSMDGSTITSSSFTLTSSGGTAVGAGVAYDDGSRTATLTPSAPLDWGTTYTARLDPSIKAADGTQLAGAVTWSFSTPSTCPCSLFSPTLIPAKTGNTTKDGRTGTGPWSYELGVKVTVDEPATMTAIRFYKDALETGTHVGKVWTAGGTKLATVTFGSETASGWQQQGLPSPLQLEPGVTYVVSVNANAYFVMTQFGLQSQAVAGPLRSVADGKNGVYGSAASVFPTLSSKSSNYFVDLVVNGQVAPPAVSSTSPADGATDVSRSAAVSATFSRSMDGSTITSSTFTLTSSGGAAVAAAVAYDDGSRTATLTPSAPLDWGTTYTARLDSSIRAADGVTLGSAVSWSFSTPSACPCSLFSPTLVPVKTGNATKDGRTGTGPWSYELGVKIGVDEPATLTAIRFYKDALETGAHVGSVWTAGGVRLATVPFASETASGWQEQGLASPLQLQPGVTYVVSVNANAYFVLTQFGLQSQIVSGPLRSVADGKNGVYGSAAGVFPSLSSKSSNYFVDVVVG